MNNQQSGWLSFLAVVVVLAVAAYIVFSKPYRPGPPGGYEGRPEYEYVTGGR